VAWGFVARRWLPEVVQQKMTDDVRAKLRPELALSEAVSGYKRFSIVR